MMEANAELLARAKALFAAQRADEAERIYRQLLTQTHVIDFEYDDWLKGIAECYRVLGRKREAGYVYLYLHQFEKAESVFTPATDPVEAARTRELEARRAQGDGARLLYLQAGEGYLQAEKHVLSAVAFAQTDAAREERRAWERVLRDPRLRGHAY